METIYISWRPNYGDLIFIIETTNNINLSTSEYFVRNKKKLT